MAKKVLTQNLSEPLGGARTATINVDVGTGNLAIDKLASGEQMLAGGTLEYMENQDCPTPSMTTINGQATFTLRAAGGRRPSFRMPWQACNAETNWLIHLNPAVSSDITAHSGGGNVKLDLAGMAVTHVVADSGGGNMDVVLPDHAADLAVSARTGGGNVTVELGGGTTGSNTVDASSGAGNVLVRVPGTMAARIHATSGMGKVIVDSRFSQMDRSTYQSPDYESAADKVEITLKSGAGNVSVDTK
jgi:cell wall-active antibiotic response 4TMS protein YvqF